IGLMILCAILLAANVVADGPKPSNTPTLTPTPSPTPVQWRRICSASATCINTFNLSGDYCLVCDGGGANYICILVPGSGADECGYGNGTTWWAICSQKTKYCNTYSLPGDPPGTKRCDFTNCPETKVEECGRWVCYH
ncbi:MAG: hypothetical protein N2246_04195, partial [Candidatus Sumerlaeia bacterium]|nr:hypothetical protein [Candidatus Sumerlaeia bacterium]